MRVKVGTSSILFCLFGWMTVQVTVDPAPVRARSCAGMILKSVFIVVVTRLRSFPILHTTAIALVPHCDADIRTV